MLITIITTVKLTIIIVIPSDSKALLIIIVIVMITNKNKKNKIKYKMPTESKRKKKFLPHYKTLKCGCKVTILTYYYPLNPTGGAHALSPSFWTLTLPLI